ncbi:MAG: chromate transporter [Eubacteriales bacterium]|nr:chromate transporter [Eubacteriales bacterium]
MTYLRLFYEFFKIGLFAVGGGMATIPFVKEMGEVTGWFTNTEIMNMLAISESTPGPIGINMATYVGYTVAGIPGGIIATLGEITPSIIIILIIAMVLDKFKSSTIVKDMFYGLRPASTGLIFAAIIGVATAVLFPNILAGDIKYAEFVFAIILYILTNYVKPLKGLHPIVFIGLSAVVGIIMNWG